jgi:hypothetical protein
VVVGIGGSVPLTPNDLSTKENATLSDGVLKLGDS